MSGRLNGVWAQQLRAIQPKAGYVDCVRHSLDLALRETARDVPMIRDSLSLVKNCTIVFRESAKRKQKLQQLADDIARSRAIDLQSMALARSIVRLIFKKVPASEGHCAETRSLLTQLQNTSQASGSCAHHILRQVRPRVYGL
jgi:hypothetical protein